MVDCGVIAVGDREPLVVRLEAIFSALQEHLSAFAPDAVFLESIFHHKSSRSALVLGHARGVAMLVAGIQKLPIDEITPAEVKKAVTGSGRAEKTQVQAMVQALLGLPQPAQEDASDALAVAMAGATRAQFAAKVTASSSAKTAWLKMLASTPGRGS